MRQRLDGMSYKTGLQHCMLTGPALAMDSRPGVLCLSVKFSSGNLLP